MRSKIPSLQALACFAAAARHESYTRAAQELALTQSAVSRQAAALEEFLGVALFQRTRPGKGRHIEMALYDCGLMITGYYGLDAMLLGHDPQRYGNAHPSIVPYGMYDAADGPLIIAVGNNAQFDKFCRQVIERPDIVEDPRFATNVARNEKDSA